MTGNAHVWHATDDLVAHYTDGTLPDPDAWSLEKHLERCGACAARVSASVRGTAAGAVLGEVREAVLREAPAAALGAASARSAAAAAPVRSAAVRAGVRVRAFRRGYTLLRPPASRRPRSVPRLVRALWAAGPAVRGAWLPAVLLVAVGALVLAHTGAVEGVRTLLLAVAPVVPVAGVALSYGPHADPLHEITSATPSGGLRLALTRSVAVLAVSLPLLTLTGLLLPASGAPGAAAWLLPGLALTLASLALASYIGCRTATAVTGGGWLAAVLAPALAEPAGGLTARLAEQLARCLDGAVAQGGWAAAAVLCAVVLTLRRPTYDRMEEP
ncbi:zf-HC2 domain-containing protein [Streptomyces brasiliensis]|uniref:Putative zinc-finger domain-containing protein n=1 Tax=Streptomyces brasiliensis TaxID=1954 RepID=A0A917L2V8_9ACTN|nr:zf-HC2 domain-containing protein [Streptomyces brasiliensis]GGJ37120.1 hypothetical protein GCM10010121_055390 [Streptomyces brasiliensis]